MPLITLTKSFVWNQLTKQIIWQIWHNNPDQRQTYFLGRWLRFTSQCPSCHHIYVNTHFHSITVGIGKKKAAFWLRKRSIQLSFIKALRTGVLALRWLKDLWQYPKAKASTAQRTPKCVRVNWMTQSISIKDFKAHIPLCVCGNWNQLQMALPVGLLQIIAGR